MRVMQTPTKTGLHLQGSEKPGRLVSGRRNNILDLFELLFDVPYPPSAGLLLKLLVIAGCFLEVCRRGAQPIRVDF